MKKKRIRIIIIVAVAVVLVAAALFLVRMLNKNKKVSVFPVNMVYDMYWGDSSQYTGFVTTGRVQNVRLRNALVEQVPVHVGQEISVGDVLLVYDAAEYQLTLLSDEAAIAVQEARIERARRMASYYSSLRPSEEAPQPYEETIDHGELPIRKKLTEKDLEPEKEKETDKKKNSKTETKPKTDETEQQEEKIREWEFMITPETVIEQSFLKKLREEGWTCRLILYQDDWNFGIVTIDGKQIPESVYVYEEVTTEEPSDDADAADETDPNDTFDADDTPDPGDSADEEAEPSGDTPEPSTEPTYHRVKKDAIQKDWILSDILSFDGTQGILKTDTENQYYAEITFHEPVQYERYEVITHYPGYDETENFMYSRAELARMVSDMNREATEAEKDLLLARITLQRDQLTAESGEVKATISGVVTEVNDPAISTEGDVIVTVRGTENFVVTTYVGELELDKVKVGDSEQVYAYESGTSVTATITEIEMIPVSSGSGYYYGGNPNNSYYPVNAVVDDPTAEMTVGEYCQVTLVSDGDGTENFYLPMMFVRSDEKGHYVMVADGNRIQKRYVKTGKNIYGSEIEIKGGLSMDDYIAFPYGSGANAGAPAVRQEDLMELYKY
ncbi:MAG: HlyD family efflux transporter periplasmic adaptor subunit [Lachnospiraceae bacterium]|nr:HlyD family efflux transporter periplasmic adaptor subunit [Lachnospiraceae bacterium]